MKQHQLRPLKLKPQSILLAAGESAINAAEDATTESSQTPASGDPVFNEPELQTDSSPSISLDLDWMTPELFPRDDFNGDEDLSLSMASASLDGMLFTPSYSSIFFQDPCMAVTSNNAGSVNGLSAPRFFDLPTSNLSSWPTSIDATTLSCYTSPKRLSNVTQYPPPDSGSPVSESTTTLVPDPQSAASTPYLQDLITATSAFLYGHPIPITPSTPPVPSAYLNYIQTTFTSTLHAYFHNLPCINLSPRDLLVHRSPFYNPCVTAGSDPEAILVSRYLLIQNVRLFFGLCSILIIQHHVLQYHFSINHPTPLSLFSPTHPATHKLTSLPLQPRPQPATPASPPTSNQH